MSEPLSDDFMASYDAALRRLIDGVASRQRVVDAALVRKAGCLCEMLVDVGCGRGIIYHHERVSCGNLFFIVDSHDPRCPRAIAEAIEKGGEG